MHIVLYVLHCCIFACICYIADYFLAVTRHPSEFVFWDFLLSCLIAINSPDYVEHVYSVYTYKWGMRKSMWSTDVWGTRTNCCWVTTANQRTLSCFYRGCLPKHIMQCITQLCKISSGCISDTAKNHAWSHKHTVIDPCWTSRLDIVEGL